MIITSRKNTKITYYRTLMRDRKARLEAGEFAVEGEKLFREAVSSGLKPTSALITQKFSSSNDDFFELIDKICEYEIINDDLAEYISDTKSPQGIFFTLPLLKSESTLDKSSNLNTIINSTRLIILDGLQDPGNVGAVIRSCDAFGIDGLILSENCADIHSPKVIRSAMGSVFRMSFLRTELKCFIPELKKRGFCVFASVLSEKAVKLGEFMFPEKSCVVIGNEGAGISSQVLQLCEKELYIPINNVQSLNAATAASIIIYEMQKGIKGRINL